MRMITMKSVALAAEAATALSVSVAAPSPATTYLTCNFTVSSIPSTRTAKVTINACSSSNMSLKVGPTVYWYNSSAGSTEYSANGGAVRIGSSTKQATGPVFSRAGWFHEG